MPELNIVIKHPTGLHARPASQFVRTAAKFPCDITVRNLTCISPSVNAKSILSVLTLGVVQNNMIQIVATGEKAIEALASLKDLIEANFADNIT